MRAPRLVRLSAALVTALACTLAAAQVPVARVNGVPIYSDALDRGFEEGLRARGMNITRLQNPALARDLKRDALETLIRNELLWQKARADGAVATDTDVDAAIAQTAAQFKTRDAFVRRIARDGFDEPGYREFVRRMLSAERVAQAMVDATVTVTDAEIEAFYRANAAQFSRPAQVRLHVILVAVPATAGADERAAARARAAAMRTKILAGEDFADMARRHSDHPTRPWGGALDPVVPAELEAPLDRWVVHAAVGTLSEPIETGAGYQVVRLDERLAPATMPLAQARDRIREYLVDLRGSEALRRAVAALRARSDVEILLPL